MIDRLLAPPASRNCLDLNALQALARDCEQQPERLSPGLAAARRHADTVLAEGFPNRARIRDLVSARAWVIEQLVLTAWRALLPPDSPLELVAVGGFGRGELHPHSDADLLVLHPDDGEVPREPLEAFVRVLWDADLHPGHGVRGLSECVEQAREDVSIATNLMESRLLWGAGLLYRELRQRTDAPELWPADEFFAAKSDEQQQRHDQFEDTVYNLEPDLKSGPGGLRDVQTVAWVAQRQFGTSTLHGLVEHGFLSEREHEQLLAARDHLWAVRWALHQLAGRAEERLLFDYQRRLAAVFGFDDAVDNVAVEAFMQRYYRTVMAVERLNEQLLQIFECPRHEPFRINAFDGEFLSGQSNDGADMTLAPSSRTQANGPETTKVLSNGSEPVAIRLKASTGSSEVIPIGCGIKAFSALLLPPDPPGASWSPFPWPLFP
ncbi:MAG: nucleotidyltransferase domain-containing protein [Wenzhouxiangellaceae bacterium]